MTPITMAILFPACCTSRYTRNPPDGRPETTMAAPPFLSPLGIIPDGSDFAAIHHARNILWGAWGNAALLAADGRPDTEIADYLTRWALLTDAEAGWAVGAAALTRHGDLPPGLLPRHARVRQLLTTPYFQPTSPQHHDVQRTDAAIEGLGAEFLKSSAWPTIRH